MAPWPALVLRPRDLTNGPALLRESGAAPSSGGGLRGSDYASGGFTSLLSAAIVMFATGRLILAATNLVVLALFVAAVVASIDLYAPDQKETDHGYV